MISLIKKDLMLARPWEYIVLASVIIMMQLTRFSPEVFAIVIFIVLTITLFFYDHYYKMNRYVGSLPINKSTVIISRYISSFIFVIAILGLQYVTVNIASIFSASYYLYTLSDLLILICLATIIISIIMPIYHIFKSFYVASVVNFSFFMIAGIGFMYLSSEKVIDETGDTIFTVTFTQLSLLDTIKLYIKTELFGIIGLLVLSLLIISYLFSVFIYKRKNIV